ncbi:MAG: hypothetical protein K9J13_12680 [Saprospiraceae bacterium]|nr:hypothetical protein [Saprospiraceae bacterium]
MKSEMINKELPLRRKSTFCPFRQLADDIDFLPPYRDGERKEINSEILYHFR